MNLHSDGSVVSALNDSTKCLSCKYVVTFLKYCVGWMTVHAVNVKNNSFIFRLLMNYIGL